MRAPFLLIIVIPATLAQFGVRQGAVTTLHEILLPAPGLHGGKNTAKFSGK
jgi:hypothetical protein